MVSRGAAGAVPHLLTRRRLGALLALLVVAAGSLFYTAHARGAGPSKCEQFAADSIKRAGLVTGSGERVVVIGDSWSVGLGLTHPAQSWPSRLTGRIHVAGFSGSGFSEHASPCGRVSFADRAPAALENGADLVVVEGGLNDFDRSAAEITSGYARLMATLAPYRKTGHVVVVGPASAPSRAAEVPRVNRTLRLLSKQYAVPYVPTRAWKLSYLPDELHLTPASHHVFGDLVASRIAALDLS